MTRSSDLLELEENQHGLADVDQRLAQARLRIAQENVHVSNLLQERIQYSAAIARIMARQDARTEQYFRETQNIETIN